MYNCECSLKFKNKGALKMHEKYCNLSKELIILIKNDYLVNKLSLRDLDEKYNVSSSLIRKILKGYTRNFSEARIISSIRKPYKHSEETKDKLRQIRLKFMKENPEKTAWRTKTMSYPEKVFNNYLKDNKIYEKYLIVREYSFFPYYIDFAFVNEKVAVEIDGSQHLKKDVKEKDLKKDKLLKEKGWRVIRVTAKEIQTNTVNTVNTILSFLKSEKIYAKVGLLEYEKYKRDFIDKEKNRIKEKEIKNKLEKIEILKIEILNSNVNFLKGGWVKKVSVILNITPQNVNRWMKRNMLDFYSNNCIVRNK